MPSVSPLPRARPSACWARTARQNHDHRHDQRHRAARRRPGERRWRACHAGRQCVEASRRLGAAGPGAVRRALSVGEPATLRRPLRPRHRASTAACRRSARAGRPRRPPQRAREDLQRRHEATPEHRRRAAARPGSDPVGRAPPSASTRSRATRSSTTSRH